jgi:hypothetical protein
MKKKGYLNNKRFIYQIRQDGIIVVEVDAQTDEIAQREIQHYALMYSQDGEVEIIRK